MTSSLDGVVQVHSWNSATGILGHLYSTKLAESITSIATDKTGDRFAFGTITGHVLFKMKGPSVTSKKRKAVPMNVCNSCSCVWNGVTGMKRIIYT